MKIDIYCARTQQDASQHIGQKMAGGITAAKLMSYAHCGNCGLKRGDAGKLLEGDTLLRKVNGQDAYVWAEEA